MALVWTAFKRTQAVRCGVNGASCISQPSPKYLLSIFLYSNGWYTNSNKRRHLRFADTDNNNEWQLNKKMANSFIQSDNMERFFPFPVLHLCPSPDARSFHSISVSLLGGAPFFFLLFSSSFHLFYYHWRDIVFTAVIFMAKHSTNPDRGASTSGKPARPADANRTGQHWKIKKGKHNSKKDLIISTVF